MSCFEECPQITNDFEAAIGAFSFEDASFARANNGGEFYLNARRQALIDTALHAFTRRSLERCAVGAPCLDLEFLIVCIQHPVNFILCHPQMINLCPCIGGKAIQCACM